MPNEVMNGAPQAQGHGEIAANEARSAPAVQQYHSPMRQHKRTPSYHREVKVRSYPSLGFGSLAEDACRGTVWLKG